MQDLYRVSLARQSERVLQTVSNGFRTIESKPFVTENENWRMHIVSTQIEQLEQVFAQRHQHGALGTS